MNVLWEFYMSESREEKESPLPNWRLFRVCEPGPDARPAVVEAQRIIAFVKSESTRKKVAVFPATYPRCCKGCQRGVRRQDP